MRVASVTGHVAWWVFVVARLMSEPGVAMGGMPRRYADYSGESLFGANIIATVAVAALAVTVVAALVEAALIRQWLVSTGTVLAPVVGAAIILTSLYERAGFLGGGHLGLPALLVFVLLGVAVREVWSRVLIPRLVRNG